MACIRDFSPSDQTQVRALILAGMREQWGDAYDPSANPDLDNTSASYVDRQAEVLVVEIAGEIVATAMRRPEGDRRRRVVRVSVEQTHRRQGFGRQVVDELVRRARRRVMLDDTTDPWRMRGGIHHGTSPPRNAGRARVAVLSGGDGTASRSHRLA